MSAHTTRDAVACWDLCKGGCGTWVPLVRCPQGYCSKCFPGRAAKALKARRLSLARAALQQVQEKPERRSGTVGGTVAKFDTFREAEAHAEEMQGRGFTTSIEWYCGEHVVTATPHKRSRGGRRG